MRIQPIAIVLVVIAVLFLIVGIIYLSTTANHLPGFLPGKPKAKVLRLPTCNAGKTNKPCYTPRKLVKRGIAGIGAGVVVLVAAYYTSGLRRSGSSHRSSGSAEPTPA